MANDLWRTPPEVLRYVEKTAGGRIVLDCCASEHNHVVPLWCDDFLGAFAPPFPPGGGLLWCNPPYSNPLPFVGKCAELALAGYQVAMILNMDPSTRWFKIIVENAARITPITSGRVGFLDGNGEPVRGNTKPQVIVFFNNSEAGPVTNYVPLSEVMSC